VVTLGPTDVAISQTATEYDEYTPGFAFEITKAEIYVIATTATASAIVNIGAVAATVARTTTAKVPAACVLATALAARRGSATDTIKLLSTTDGSGDYTGLRIRVTFRPIGIGGLPDQPGTQ